METPVTASKLYTSIQNYTDVIITEFDQIPQQRKQILDELASYIRLKFKENLPVQLIFICTHNSRRSHISQIWAQTAAYFYGINDVETYSGGTEATAFNPRAVRAMEKAGFHIEKTGKDSNPVYLVKYAENAAPIMAFSKTYDAAGNPKAHFAAVMTCSQADQACPFIPGADIRIAVPYDDPKASDGTAQEDAIYDERTRQIARETMYTFSQVK